MNITEIPKFVNSHTKEELRSIPLVERLVCEVGLHNDPRISDHYGVNEKYLVDNGMLQQPRQFAEALVFLSHREIKSYLEIGTFHGVGTVFITSYLSVFEPTLTSVTVDNLRGIDISTLQVLKEQGVDIHQVIGTSNDLKKIKSDLCFIDGDHNYDWVVKDYVNVGKYAKHCMFHDIQDEWVNEQVEGGGSIKQWAELKERFPERRFYEFTYHPEDKKYFGIGIMIKGEK